MHLQTLLPVLSALGATAAITSKPPVHLWATHYNGNVYTLTLKSNDLSISQTLDTCGDMPSWLTLDAHTRTVYCSDETGTADPSTHGSLTALHVNPDGTLREGAVAKAVGGGVNSVIYEAGAGKKFLAIAHYEGSAISTFALPIKQNQPALQAFHFNLTRPGKVAQQDSPHPHEVFLDPTGSFIVSPDLGADLLRVYAIEDDRSGKLSECPSVNVTFGSGPRHGVFWTDGSDRSAGLGSTHSQKTEAVGETMMYLANEIGGTMMVFDVSYPRSGCLSFEKTQTMVPYPGGVMPEGATPAAISRIGDDFYVSIRSDQGFASSDSMVVLDRSPEDGSLELRDSSSALGKVPRTFVINRAGDLVAIGNQASATVAIVRRDPKTGNLGQEVATVQVGEPGKVGTAEGLSSVIWDE
ncbi:Cytochrome cd1-nitrite reductase-like C-terminal heme d1 [Penicillium robsamsonii]|uniref:Cytochrome cd1-nitrite reductase-like C-terminal heme d1 n=1 Tax=Penicillium robsamsonii TaxID=1792511 RepID=UPI0025482951|nr:Cytochrome cd1-nitrite reductase-like C-terminal heme d1 [Penicillium robsamsonii]KAJ5822976.1 Cytochrome cd1-nitrite reductase-like C-terminal heme d1 [Penicillium robsamsonii]